MNTLIDVTTTLIEVQTLFTVSTAMKTLQQLIQMELISAIHHKITPTMEHFLNISKHKDNIFVYA